jgi:hypothetical protein
MALGVEDNTEMDLWQIMCRDMKQIELDQEIPAMGFSISSIERSHFYYHKVN